MADFSVPIIFYLMARHGSRAVIPLDEVATDYFPHLGTQKLLQKCLRGEIALPIVRIEGSQKAARGVDIRDLAVYIDRRREAAIRERDALCGLD